MGISKENLEKQTLKKFSVYPTSPHLPTATIFLHENTHLPIPTMKQNAANIVFPSEQ